MKLVAGKKGRRQKTLQSPRDLDLLEYRALASVLAVTRQTLDRLAAEDPTFPVTVKLGKLLYVRSRDVKAWVDARFDAGKQRAA